MLQKINFLPGFNKQLTETQAEGQWVGGDNVRFRYSTPEKIGDGSSWERINLPVQLEPCITLLINQVTNFLL